MFRTHLSRRFRSWRKSETGAVAIEFVLLAPLLFALLFGIICVGYAMALSHSVNQLATSTARASVSGLTEAERRDLAEIYLSEASVHYPLLMQEAIRPTLDVVSNPTAQITVEIAYDLNGSILDIANGFLGLNLSTLEAEAYLAY